jgi:hypothetical protein
MEQSLQPAVGLRSQDGMSMQKIKTGFIAAGLIVLAASGAWAGDLAGSWRGKGTISFASGAREQATCRAEYRRRANEGYVVRAICATPSGRAEQTAALQRVSENTYRGTFYNREYGISGTIYVRTNGNTQTVRLTSEAGSASLRFRR